MSTCHQQKPQNGPFYIILSLLFYLFNKYISMTAHFTKCEMDGVPLTVKKISQQLKLFKK